MRIFATGYALAAVVLIIALSGFFVHVERTYAQEITLDGLVELFISLGIIPPEKADIARKVLSSNTNTPPEPPLAIPKENKENIPQTLVSFTRNLTIGDTGNDVRNLQKTLNSQPGIQVAEFGPGSLGQETDYFGPRTQFAVVLFQERYKNEILTPAGLSFGTGYVGPATRKKLNSIVSGEGGIAQSTADLFSLNENNLSGAFSGAPVIFYPSRYDGKWGERIQLTGSGFTPEENTVSFGTRYITTVSRENDSELLFIIPEILPARYEVSVMNKNGTSNTISFIITSPASRSPVIEHVFPKDLRKGEIITIEGKGFSEEENIIHTGYGVIDDVSSPDGKTLSFVVHVPNTLGSLSSADSEFIDPLEGLEITDEEFSGELYTDEPETFWIYVENNNGVSNGMPFQYYLK